MTCLLLRPMLSNDFVETCQLDWLVRSLCMGEDGGEGQRVPRRWQFCWGILAEREGRGRGSPGSKVCGLPAKVSWEGPIGWLCGDYEVNNHVLMDR